MSDEQQQIVQQTIGDREEVEFPVQEDEFVVQQAVSGGQFLVNESDDGEFQVQQVSDGGGFVEQSAGYWNPRWCSATMGGVCHYNAEDVCKQCHVSRADKQAQIANE